MTTIMNETLSGLMSGPRARGAFLLRSGLDPWRGRAVVSAEAVLAGWRRGGARLLAGATRGG